MAMGAAPPFGALSRLLEHPILKAFALLLEPGRFHVHGAEHPLGAGGPHNMVASTLGARRLDAAAVVPTEVARDLFVHGTPKAVARQLRQYDADHVVLWDPVPLVDLTAGQRSTAGCGEDRPTALVTDVISSYNERETS